MGSSQSFFRSRMKAHSSRTSVKELIRIAGTARWGRSELAFEGATFPLLLSYTLTRAVFENTFVSQDPIFGSVTEGDEMPYVPRHQLVGSVGVENETGGVAVAFQYVAAMREEAGSGPLDEALATDEQFWIDVGARYHLLPALTLYANVRNVLNQRNIVSRRPYGARPNAPRWVHVGAKLQY